MEVNRAMVENAVGNEAMISNISNKESNKKPNKKLYIVIFSFYFV